MKHHPHAPATPARIDLADAIAHRDFAERELRQARDAGETAFQRKIDARKALDRFLNARAEGPPEDTQSLIDAIRGGDASVMERAATRSKEAEAELTHQRDLWVQAHRVCEQAIADRERDLERAKLRVTAAAAHVIRGSVELNDFLEKQEATWRAYDAGCEALRFLSSNGFLTNDQTLRAERIMPAQTVSPTRRSDQSVRSEWEDALRLLQIDPDAALPGSSV